MPGALRLIEGPVFSGKSQVAKDAIRDDEADILVEYSSLWAATRAVERDPDTGKYPVRADDDPFNEMGYGVALKSAAVSMALRRDLRVIVSSGVRGEVEKWRDVAAVQSAKFSVQTIDPGADKILQRIEDNGGEIQCYAAGQRWYGKGFGKK